MKSLKLFFLLAIGSLSIGAAAQNYKVKGIVIDAYARPITGAKISTDKSKAVAYTDPSGVYTIEVMPRDKNLSLTIINDKVNMVKPISAEIAQNPVNFEVDDTRPLKGHLSKDGMTYFVGKEDENWRDIIQEFGGLSIGVNNDVIYDRLTQRVIYFSKQCSPSEVYSIKLIRPSDPGSFRYKYMSSNQSGVMEVTTIEDFHTQVEEHLLQKKNNYIKDDTLRGVVTDMWDRPVKGMSLKTPSGEEAVSDDSGRYAIRVTKKDKFLRCVTDYTEGTTVRIKYANRHLPVNLTVMLHRNTLRGWRNPDDPMMYHPGDNESWRDILGMFSGITYNEEKMMVYINRHRKTSLNGSWEPALIVLDGSSIGFCFESIEPKSIYSIKFIMDNAVPLYGTEAQCGAVEIVTKGMQAVRPVELTDFAANKAKHRGDMKGFIATQGKNIEYDDSGYILVNGKRCGLYIINDKEFTHMRGIEVDMIDDIIILNDDYTASYGEKAKNGVVLISASQKEKKVVDEEGNTVTEKE
ncbi:MAG: hypothetical protein IIY15_05630, partial [Flavobacteriales bacterium]|nr:hypothetical protein [Flavobacteriales bacterium]